MEGKTERIKTIPEFKKATVAMLVEKMKSGKTVLVTSIKSLPASHFQTIKSKLRDRAEILVAKKTIVNRALVESGKGSLIGLKRKIGADVALVFSELSAFELAGMLVDNQSFAKAKIGDIVPEDIRVEEGLTDLIPGPAISELGAVGLKVGVEGGKLAIKVAKTIAQKGDVVTGKLVNVFGKLKINPMKVGFIPIAAFDAGDDIIYEEINIDKKGALESLKESIGKAFGFAVNVGYYTQQTVKYFIVNAGLEEMVLSVKLGTIESNDNSGKEDTQ